MSTLMSRDLNLTRSSTRVRDPPGGKSSISFGDEYSAPAPSRSYGQYDPSSSAKNLSFGNEYSAPVRNHGEYAPQNSRQQSNNDYSAPSRNQGQGQYVSAQGRQQEYAAPVRNQGQYSPSSKGRQQSNEYAAPVRNQGQYAPSSQGRTNNITQHDQYDDVPAQRANRRPSTSPDKSSMKGVVNQDFSYQEAPSRNYRQAPGGRSSIVIG